MRNNILDSLKQGEVVTPNLPVEGQPSILDKLKAGEVPTPKGLELAKNVEGENTHNIDVSEYSKYIPEGVFDNEALNETRAQRQGEIEKAIHGIGKGAGLAGTTFANTFTSLPFGVVSAILSGRGADVYDNPISNYYDEFNKGLEKSLPNYYTKKEQDADLYSPSYWFSTNFLFDKLIKNAGFTVGAILGGAATAKGLQALGKISMGGAAEAEISSIAALEAEGKTVAEALSKAASKVRLTNAVTKLGATTVAAGSEAMFEALDGRKTVYNDLVNNYKDANGGLDPQGYELQKIQDAADASANVRFALNMGLLGIGDYMQFPRMLSGITNERSALKAIGKDAAGALAAEAPGKIERILKAGKGLITEANEEGTQYAIQTGTQDYYERKYDKGGKSTLSDILNSVAKGLQDEFGTKEGIENILLGGLTGLGFGFITGESQRAFRSNSAEIEHAMADLKQYTSSGIFKGRYDAAVRDKSIETEMEQAVKTNDIFQYKNLEWDKFKNFVDSRSKIGRFDILVDELNELKDLPKEEFEKTFGVGYDGKNKVPSQYIDNLVKEAKVLNNLRRDIDDRFAGYDGVTRDKMYDAASNGYNVDKREQELGAELAALTKGHVSRVNAQPGAAIPDVHPIDYTKLRGLEDNDFKVAAQTAVDTWFKTANPSPLDKIKAFEIIRDLNQLRIRRHNFSVLYRRLVDQQYNQDINAKVAEKEKEIADKEFTAYSDEVKARVTTATDKNGLLTDLKTELGKQKEDRYKKVVEGHIKNIENEIKLNNNKTVVQDAKAVVANPVVATVAPTAPPVEIKPSNTDSPVDVFRKGLLYSQVQRKIAKNTTEDISDAIDDLEQVVEKHPSQSVKDFAKTEIEILKAKSEPATAEVTTAEQIVETNEQSILDVLTTSVETKLEATPEVENAPVENLSDSSLSANVFLMDIEDGISKNKVIKNEDAVRSLLSPSLGVGSELTLVADETNHYGQIGDAHTMETLPIEVKDKHGNRLGFVNNLNSVKAQLELAKQIDRTRLPELLKMAVDPDVDKNTKMLVNVKLNKTSFGNGEVTRNLGNLIAGWQDNYTATKKIREAIFAAKDKTFKTTVTKKTSGSITKSSKVKNVEEVFGLNVRLFAPIADATGELPTTQLESLDDKKERFSRNPVTSAFTNHDRQYTLGSLYVLIDGANVDKNDINTKLPSPLIDGVVGSIWANFVTKDIIDLLGYLKQGKSLNSQEVENLRNRIGTIIQVNSLDSKHNSFKIHADNIQIDTGENTVFLYTKGYNVAKKESYPLEGFNLTVVNNTSQETINIINSAASPAEFNKELSKVIAEKGRQADYKRLRSDEAFTDPYFGTTDKNYKEWLIKTEGVLTDVSILRAGNNEAISHVTPVGKANLVLSINSDITFADEKLEKGEEKVPTQTEQQVPEVKEEITKKDEDDLTGLFSGSSPVDDMATAIENNVTKKEIEELKVELKVETKEEVVEKIQEAIIEDIIANKDKINTSAKTLLQRIVARIKKLLLAFLIGSTVFTSTTGFTVSNESNTITFDKDKVIEAAISILPEVKEEYAKRFLEKIGVYQTKDQIVQVKSNIEVTAPKIVNHKVKPTLEILSSVPDSYHPTDSLVVYRSTWNNDDGFTYVVAPNKAERKGKNVILPNVVGVGHFLLDASLYTDVPYSHANNVHFLDAAKKHGDYIPAFTKLGDGKVSVKYKRPSEITKEDIVVSPLRQFTANNIDWNKTGSAVGFKSPIKEIKTVEGKGTYLIFKDRNGYSRFSGGSVVFIFEKEGNRVVVDFAGSVEMIKNETNRIIKDYGISANDLTVGYHDLGSFSAKPKARNGNINTAQYEGYNNEGFTGAGLLIPIPVVSTEKATVQADAQDDLTNIFYSYYNENLPSFVRKNIPLDDYGFQNGQTYAHLALDGIIKNSTGEQQEVAKFLRAHISKNNTKIVYGDTGRGAGSYNNVTNTIIINKSAKVGNKIVPLVFPSIERYNRLLLHEIKHSLTVYPFLMTSEGKGSDAGMQYTHREEANIAEKQFVKDINALYSKAIQYYGEHRASIDEYPSGETVHYGFNNVVEFIAEIDTNPRFRELLESIKLEEVPEGIIKRFFYYIKKFFRDLFGIENGVSPYKEAVNVINNFIGQTYSDAQRSNLSPLKNKEKITVEGEVPVYTREADAHYVNIMAGLIFDQIKKNPDLTFREIQADPTLSLKFRVHNTLKIAAEKGLVKDDRQKDIFLEIAESINDTVEGKWNPVSVKDDLAFWAKAKDYVNRRLGFSIEDDIDITVLKENRRDWDDTNVARVSSKSGVSNAIKVMIMTSPVLNSTEFTIGKDGNIKYDADKDTISGIASFVDYDVVYPYILKNMIGIHNAQDVFARLDIMAAHDPSFIRIKHQLEADSVLLSDWIRQFSLQNPQRDYVKIETNRDKVNIELDQANKETDPVLVISNRWINKIKTLIDNKYYDEKVRHEFVSIYKDLDAALYNNKIADATDLLYKGFKKLGADIDKKVFDKEISNPANLEKYSIYNEDGSRNLYKTINNILSKEFVDRLRFLTGSVFTGKFNEYGNLNALAKIVSLYTYDIAEGNYLSVQGKTIYSAMLPNYLSRLFNLFESNNKDAKKELEGWIRNNARVDDMAYSNWMWDMKGFSKGMLKATVENNKFTKKPNVAEINQDFISKFKYGFLDGSKRTDTKQSRVYDNYSDRDWKLTQLNLFLDKRNPAEWTKVPILVPSDSGNIYYLQVPKVRLISGQLAGTRLSRESNLWKSVYRTVLQEVERMKVARDYLFDIGANGALVERPVTGKLQRYYHYQDVDVNGKPIVLKDGKPTGNVFKFSNIPELNTKDLRVNGVLYPHLTDVHIGDIKSTVDKFIESQIVVGLNEYGKLSDALEGSHDNIGNGSWTDLMAEFVLNSYIANVEQSNFFYGSVAEYKSAIDTNKRAKQVSTPGSVLSGLFTGETYRAVTLRDVKLKSQLYNQLKDAVVDKIKEERGQATAEDINNVVGSYAKINTADAQGYISLSRYRNVLKDLGKWNTKMDTLYDKVKSGDALNSDDIKNFLQPLKPFYYGREYDPILNRFISNQVKYALVPLIPQLTVGTQLDDLRKYIETNGIDEVYFESSEKVGATDITDITDGEGNLVKEKLKSLNPKVYYNKNWQQQLDVPDHITDEVNLLGTQIMKLIIANINTDISYKWGNFKSTGKELINHYHEVLNANIKESSDKLLKELGAEVKGDTVTIPDISKFQDILLDELNKRGLSNNYKSAIGLRTLNDGTVTFKLPLFISNMSDKFESVATALFTNNITNQKFPGLHAVLLSDVFLTGDAKTINDLTETKVGKTTGIEYSKEFLEEVKAGNRTTKLRTKLVDGALVHEVLVGAWSKRFFKDGQRISIDDIAPELRKMIAYRIPTQAKHSMAYMEVVGFLPSVSGSTMTFPDDIVTQMNGDFDLDTIYVMTQNFRETRVDGIKVYQGTADVVDARDYNYFTDVEAEAKGYGKVRTAVLNPKKIFEVYGKDRKQLIDITNSLAVTFDILDNSKEGLATQAKVFDAIKAKGYDAVSLIHNEGKIADHEDNRYIISLNNDIITEIPTKFESVKYTEGNTEADIDARYNALYGRADTLRNYLDRVIAGEYSEMLDVKDAAIDKLFDVIFEEVPLLFTDDEINEILTEKGYSLELYNKIVEKIKDYPSRAEFAKLDVVDQNSRKARENRIFEIYSAILTNPEHVKEVVTPAEYNDLIADQKLINKLYNQEDSSINAMTNNGQNTFRSKAIQGRALKGMAANANAFAAVAQVAKIKLHDDLGYIVRYKDRLDERRALYGKDVIQDSKDSIVVLHKNIGFAPDGSYRNADGYLITEKASQTIGNVVDIVKEGFIPYINTYTFDGWQTGQIVGVSSTVMSLFYNQPVIRNLVDRYFDNQSLLEVRTSTEIEDIKRGYQTALFKLLNQDKIYKIGKSKDKVYKKAVWAITEDKNKNKQARPIYVTREDTEKLLEYNPDETLPLDLDELTAQIASYNKYNRGLNAEEKINFLKYQLKVLEMFKRYKEAGEAVADGIKIFNTNRLGASPSMNVTRTLDKNIDYFSDYGAEGRPRLLVGDRPAAEAVYPSAGSKQKSVYPMLQSYYQYSNKRSISALSPQWIQQSSYFQRWLSDSFATLRKAFNEEIAANLSRFANSYMMQELPILNGANVARILGVDTKVNYDVDTRGEEWKALSVANKVMLAQEFLKETTLAEYPNHILKYLSPQVTNQDIERNKFQNIKFLDTGNDPIVDDYLVDSFNDMWKSSDARVADLARDLFRFSYFTNGFTYGKDSFAKVIDADILADDTENGVALGSFLRAKQDQAEQAKTGESIFPGGDDEVLLSYLQNNWYDREIVPIVKTEYEWVVGEGGKKFIKEEYIDDASEATYRVTKNNTPVWEADKNGIIVVDRSKLKRVDKNIRNAQIVRVLEYQKPDSLYKRLEVGEVELVSEFPKDKVYYYPVNKLGNILMMEFSTDSVVKDNNVAHTKEFYLNVLKSYIDGNGGGTVQPVEVNPIPTTPTTGETFNKLLSADEALELFGFDVPNKDIEDNYNHCK